MSRIYQEPPIVEALCEFQFISNNWDWTIPGIIYQQVYQRFPKKRQVRQVEVKVMPETKEVSQAIPEIVERIQFSSDDGHQLFQVGPNMLAVNCVGFYPKWSDFSVLIHEMYDIYRSIANPSSIKRIGLRYINRIEIPETRFEISSYFNIEPKLPDEIPNNYVNLFMRIELPFTSSNGILALTFGSTPVKKVDQSSFILDLDYSTQPNLNIEFEMCGSWVENAHSDIETAFEACISDRLRELFKEIKP
jgi:uncharacterized protein (TIGR04255 family)